MRWRNETRVLKKFIIMRAGIIEAMGKSYIIAKIKEN